MRPGWRWGVALWGAVLLALGALEPLRPPALGEPLSLRWVRKVREHPVRGAVALGLVLVALRPPGRRGAGGPGTPASGRPPPEQEEGATPPSSDRVPSCRMAPRPSAGRGPKRR